jgi:probable HAF family extracellular repeat protein
MHPRPPLAAVWLSVALAAALPAQAAKDTFTAKRIDGPYGEHFWRGISLNNRGQAVATVNMPDVLWWITARDGRNYHSMPWKQVASMGAINNAGTAVGSSDVDFGIRRAFVTDWNAVLTEIPPPGASSSWAEGIDDAGRVAGAAVYPEGTRAFVTNADRSRFQVLGTLGGTSSDAHAIRKGVVVGESTTADGATHAFRVDAGQGAMTDLGTIGGGATSRAHDVNVRGQVVGDGSDAGGHPLGFITAADGVTLQALSNLGPVHNLAGSSSALGINAHGNVVGTATDPATQRNRAFVTGADGHGMYDLNRYTTLRYGGFLGVATAINDQGQILATEDGDEGRVWLLTPTRPAWQRELEEDAGD